MKRRSKIIDLAVVAVCFIGQSGIVVYALVATYMLKLTKDKEETPQYAFPLMAAGALTLAFGIWLCTVIVGQSSDEKVYYRKLPNIAPQN